MSWYDDAWGGNDDAYGEYKPDVNEILFGSGPELDQHAQDLFRDAMFDGNDDAYIELVEYMYDEYGLDFEEVFDWEDFREWYDSQ